MDGLILLIVLLPILLIVLLLTLVIRSGEQRKVIDNLSDNIKELRNDLRALTEQLKQEKKESPQTFYKEPVREPKPVVIPKKIIPDDPVKEPEKIIEPVEVIQQAEPVTEATTKPVIPIEDLLTDITGHAADKKDRGTDLEKFIGENLANKIGIAVLVLGIGFFVKYAIDKDWVQESGRVIIGLVSGGILLAFAHYFRDRYRSFSSVLVGGGLTVFYFSIGFAFHQYHLISQVTAFIAMVGVAALGVVLSLFYNRQELAILATIGGFITPFLVNTGNDNYTALFTYLAILNAGVIALSWFKRWKTINIIALVFTTIIFAGWLIRRMDNELVPFPRKTVFLFATLFYLQLVAISLVNSLRFKNSFGAFDFLIPLATNFLYYAAGVVVLQHHDENSFTGLFTFSLGVFNLLMSGVFHRIGKVDRVLVFLSLGLGIAFVSLAIPIQLKGQFITLAWAAETLLLLFLYQKTKISLLRNASVFLLPAMLVSLIFTWVDVYFSITEIAPIVVNRGFITTLAVALCLFGWHRMATIEVDPEKQGNLDIGFIKKTVKVVAIIVTYLAGVLEIHYQISRNFIEAPVHIIFLQAYSFAFVIVLLQFLKKEPSYKLLKTLFTIFCFGIYLFNIGGMADVSDWLLAGTGHDMIFLFRWLADGLLLWLLYDLVRFVFKNKEPIMEEYRSSFTWVASISIVLVLSIELYHVIAWMNYKEPSHLVWWKNLYSKAGLSIIWSLCSFTMMWLGMKYSFRTLRIISLSLFTITLAKLFLFDIRNIPPGGKIAAFILLGILLLVVSFMYQRLKKIIIDDTES